MTESPTCCGTDCARAATVNGKPRSRVWLLLFRWVVVPEVEADDA